MEKILCVEIELPKKEQVYLGISGFTEKLSDLQNFIEDDFENWDGEQKIYKIKVFKRTKKWIESLPEADI